MPIYEYRCPRCKVSFERLLKHSEREEPQSCPDEKCGEKETGKLVSRTSFSLKGSGWASDGYSG